MITIRRGDIFAEQVDGLVNPVNCLGVMGAGIAIQFKNRFHEYHADYVKKCRDGYVTPGCLTWWHGNWTPRGAPLSIVNFPTKYHWRDKSKIRDIANGLHELGNWMNDVLGIGTVTKSIAIPALGCGLGGLDWGVVRPLMTSMLEAHAPEADIRIYEPH